MAHAAYMYATGPFGGNRSAAVQASIPQVASVDDTQTAASGQNRITHVSLQIGQMPYRGLQQPSLTVVMNLNFTYQGVGRGEPGAGTNKGGGIGRQDKGSCGMQQLTLTAVVVNLSFTRERVERGRGNRGQR